MNILSERRFVMKAHSSVSSEHQSAVFDTLVENCFDSVMISEATPKNPIVYVNKAFSDLTGYCMEEVLGKSPGFLQGSGTDASVLQRLHEDMAAGRVFEGKAVNYRKDGSHFTMWWRVIPVTCNSAQPMYFVAFQREALPI
jgi:PAS domain S-box-containing protein